MNNYVRSPRATDRLTEREEREGIEEQDITQTTVLTHPRPPYMVVAPTTAEAVDAEAIATALDTVGSFKNQMTQNAVICC